MFREAWDNFPSKHVDRGFNYMSLRYIAQEKNTGIQVQEYEPTWAYKKRMSTEVQCQQLAI